MCTIIAELDRDGKLKQEINEEELKESLRCEMLEKCTPQFCCTCQQKFLSQVDSKAHYDGKPHQKLLQIKLKILLRKKISEENLRRKLGDSEVINTATIATETKQIVTAEISGVKDSIKEETLKRPGDHLDELCDLPSSLPEECLPTYCGLCFTSLNSENDSRNHYEGKPHKKKLKLLEMKRNPSSYTCTLCQVTTNTKVQLEIHCQGSKHRSKETLQEAMRTHTETLDVKNEQAISIQSMKSGSSPQKENMNGLYCDVCDVTGSSVMDLNKHLDGKSHKKKEKQKNGKVHKKKEKQKKRKVHKEKLNLTFTCYLCQVSCSSQETLEAHLVGELHKKKLNYIQVVSYVSFEEQSKRGNVVEELEKSFAAKMESMPTEAAVMMDEKISENSALIDEKTDYYDEIKETADSKDSMSKPVGHNDTDMESMSMQTTDEMDENTSEKCEIKNEDPGLCDSMSNLAGYSVDTKNNELKIKLEEKELLHLAEIVKSSSSKSSKEEDIVLLTENIDVKKLVKEDDECEEADSSDDDLIILENPDCSSPLKSIQNNQKLNNAPLVESVKLCVYPVGQSESVTVSTQDYATLAYDTFLNDIIIDFYLLYLANNVLSNNDREKIHIFSTMFYKRLLQSPRADAKKVPEYETDASLTTSEIRHFRVASWTKSVDLFEKDMLIIPICEEFHWYLLLVVKPGVIFLPFEARERKEKGEPFMIVLDSVGGRNNASAKNIRRYLACEWNKKKCAGAELLTNLEQMGKNMQKIRPNKPEQENNSDCGIFLLQYVETVFKNVSAFMWPFLVNMRTKEWFTSQEVAGKRGEIAHLIKRLTEEQKPGEVIEYPNIKFTAAKGVDDV